MNDHRRRRNVPVARVLRGRETVAEELLWKAGFSDVRRVEYLHTVSSYPEIFELDSREGESFYVEAFK